MSNRLLCKFFMNGACLKGDYCKFSHDMNDQPNNVCTYYQKGVCSYGSRCRYEHAELSPPPSTIAAQAASNSSQILGSAGRQCEADVNNQTCQIGKPASALYAHQPVRRFGLYEDSIPEDGKSWCSDQQNRSYVIPAHLPMCSFAAAGTCPYGEDCPQMHGDLCTTCGKQCLHPYRPRENKEHIRQCKRDKSNNRRLETLKKSEDIECGVCMDHVLSKPTAAERRFGILSECDHSFCITCIRKWRSSSPTSGMDVDSTVRACPICRKISYYVIPSVMWYFSKEEKQEIVDGYKAKLKSIDCKYFDFGKDTCPFGSICFYKHAYSDGRLAEASKIHLCPDDGNASIIRSIGLSYLLSRLHL